MPTTFRYVLADVFTSTALEGNQLAVFTDAREIPEELLQKIAREMNLSETVFVLPPEAGGHARIRIFTPVAELPFAGHPVLGSAFVLGAPLQLVEIRLETRSGVIPVALEREGARITFGRMQQPIPNWEPFEQAEELQELLGVRSQLPVEAYDLGPHHVFLALGSEAEVAALEPDFGALGRLTPVGVNCFAGLGDEVEDADVRAGERGCGGSSNWLGVRPARHPSGASRPYRVRPGGRGVTGRRDREALDALCSRGRIDGKHRARRSRRLRGRRSARRVSSLERTCSLQPRLGVGHRAVRLTEESRIRRDRCSQAVSPRVTPDTSWCQTP